MLIKVFKIFVLFFSVLYEVNAVETTDFTLPLFRAEYDLQAYNIKIATAVRQLQQHPEGYILTTDSNTVGMARLFRSDFIREESIFQWESQQVKPLHYQYKHDSHRKKRHTLIDFDWTKQVAKSALPDDAWQVALQADSVDKLSYQIMLMRDLTLGKPDIAYTVADKGKLKKYTLSVKAKETLDTALGKTATIKLHHQGSNQERFSFLWCAPSLHYLPVKVEHHEPNGDVVTMLIQSVHFENPD